MHELAKIQIPEYVDMLPIWTQWAILWRGGETLIAQLPKLSEFESDPCFESRKLASPDVVFPRNFVQEQLDILTLSNIGVSVADKELNDFLQSNVDGSGKDITKFLIDDILSCALAFEHCYVVVDRVAIQSGLTAAQAEKLEDPYAFVLKPQAVPAWRYRSGLMNDLDQVITLSDGVKETDHLGFVKDTEPLFTFWNDELIVTQTEDGNQRDERVQSLGQVPILRFDLQDSLFEGLYPAVISANQHFSIASKCAQNQIGLPVFFTQMDLTQVDVGNMAGLKLGPNDKVAVISSPVEGIAKNLELVDNLQAAIRRKIRDKQAAMVIKGGGSGGSAAIAASGISKKVDQAAQEAFSRFLAGEMKKFAPRIIGLFAQYFGKDSEQEVKFDMPDDFVSRDRETDRLDGQYLSLNFQPKERETWIATQKRLRKLSGIETEMGDKDITESDKNYEVAADLLFSDEGLENIADPTTVQVNDDDDDNDE